MLCFVILLLHFPAFVKRKNISAIFSTRKQRRLLLSHTLRHIYLMNILVESRKPDEMGNRICHYLGRAAGRNHGRGGLEEPLEVAPSRRSIAGGEPSARTCRHLRSLPLALGNRGSQGISPSPRGGGC